MEHRSPQVISPTLKAYSATKSTRLICMAFSLILPACQHIPIEANKPIHLTILHTNDHHGRFWVNAKGEYGMAARKTLIDQIRAEVSAKGGYSLLLSGGDINTGVPESDTLDAEPDFRGMTKLGYDAMAVGNHEFDNSVATIRKQESWSNFPFLAANIYNQQKQRLFAPYQVFEFDNFKVGVIGLITHTTAFIGNQEFIKGLTFTLPEEETQTVIDTLAQQVDVVVALTHMGHNDTDLGSDVSLAKAVDGLDMIIGGHSSQAICVDENGQVIADYQPGQDCQPDRVNGTWVMQAYEWGRYVGRADFIYQQGKLTLESYRLIPVNLRDKQGQLVGEPIAQDKEMLALLTPYQEAGSEALAEVIGVAKGEFVRSVDAFLPHSSPMGKLLTQSMLEATGADIALFNEGGIRDGIRPGDITLRDILKVQPFNNTVVLNRFTGAELLAYLKSAEVFDNNRKGIQFSGLYFNEQGQLFVSKTNQPINSNASYLVALNNYMAGGGDGLPALNHKPTYMDTGMMDYQVLVDFIRAVSPLTP